MLRIGVYNGALPWSRLHRSNDIIDHSPENFSVKWVEEIEQIRVVGDDEGTCVVVDDGPARIDLPCFSIQPLQISHRGKAQRLRDLDADHSFDRQRGGEHERTSHTATVVDECCITTIGADKGKDLVEDQIARGKIVRGMA